MNLSPDFGTRFQRELLFFGDAFQYNMDKLRVGSLYSKNEMDTFSHFNTIP